MLPKQRENYENSEIEKKETIRSIISEEIGPRKDRKNRQKKLQKDKNTVVIALLDFI